MTTRKRRKFTEQFKLDAVQMVLVAGKSVTEIAKQFDLSETALREWIKRAQTDTVQGAPNALTTAERAELVDLRKRLKRAEMERDILKKATAFFAKHAN